ncbi:hypothetical protein Pf1_02598 [Flavobacterium columnare]|uniref:DUF6438 domain-containing protein n=1 Tax=Flavobacterium columnare TaxID=996 RepID=UPI0007F9BD4F|nr:DUF6438 domain-containing protein [Flavobacterium columnare]ANO48052.1 hypothetical protein Pf1_02598 [Flavobacterium columnare]APT21373.1 hypothetical protein BU993_01205 [Flavobacterium columnare]
MKVKNQIILIFLILFASSCNSNHDIEYQKNIIGEWEFFKCENLHDEDSEILLFTFSEPRTGYSFYKDKSCDTKLGYLTTSKSTNFDDRIVTFQGTKTKYKIENDSLKIFNLTTKKWDIKKIIQITQDTLSFEIDKKTSYVFAKKRYHINKNEAYDKIIVSSSGCYGTCPISNTMLDNKGNMVFQGQEYNTKNGVFKSKISNSEFKKIHTSFLKANIKSLKKRYSKNVSDQETVSISFIKNNKIIKTIEDYGMISPNELIWAYIPVRFLYQKVNLSSINSNKFLSNIWYISFRKKDSINTLSKSESFFLVNEIYNGKKVNQKFRDEYYISYIDNNDIQYKIKTDGRFYNFNNMTIDIGYNFLTQNNLLKNFRKRTDYD